MDLQGPIDSHASAQSSEYVNLAAIFTDDGERTSSYINPSSLLKQQRDLLWERLRPKIYQLYIAENKTLSTVIETIRDEENVAATSKMFTTQLRKWNYKKNTSLHEVIKAQGLKADSVVGIPLANSTPNKLKRVTHLAEKYKKRNRRDLAARTNIRQSSLLNYMVPSYFSGPITIHNPSLPQAYLLDESFLHHLEDYMRFSFETRLWRFTNIDELIESATGDETSRSVIHSLLSAIELGCTKSARGDAAAAELYWRAALRDADYLVRGTYHDNIPNIIQELSKLQSRGHTKIAMRLVEEIAKRSNDDHLTDRTRQAVFNMMRDLDLNHLSDMEERVLKLYCDIFEWHLGRDCYNTFVTRMNYARKRLEHNPQLSPKTILPSLEHISYAFGPCDRRAMDIITFRTECLLQQGKFMKAIEGGNDLIKRASLQIDNEWVQMNFCLNGWYLRGSAEYKMGKDDAIASVSLQHFLKLLDDFEKLESAPMFNPEKMNTYEQLEQIADRNRYPEAAAHWRGKQSEVMMVLKSMNDFINEG